jgi:hypothetical protein
MGNSFYGGRDARPFYIKKIFNTVEDMVSNFKDGLSYSDVNFEEYVMIQTTDRNDKTNGNIYKRGYIFNNELGGAEYIGNIVGPAGGAPLLSFEKSFKEIGNLSGGGSNVLKGQASAELVPGYDKTSNVYNNNIKWNWYSERDINNQSTTVFVGAQIPYTVFDFTVESIGAYNDPVATRNTKSTNYFYEQWKLGIPKGIKGDSSQIAMIGSADSNNQTILISNTNYDNEKPVTKEESFPYNVIKNVNLSEKGNLTIEMTGGSNYSSGDKITYLKDASLSDNGVLNFTFNNNTIPAISKEIDWITAADFTEGGALTLTFANGSCLQHPSSENDPTSIVQVITWIKEASLNENTGDFNIKFNNNFKGDTPDISTKLTWIKEASLDETGEFSFTLNNAAKKTLQIPLISKADITDTGKLKITFKNNHSILTDSALKQVKNIAYENGYIHFNYSDNTSYSVAFPQNYYISPEEPSSAPSGSVWAKVETI